MIFEHGRQISYRKGCRCIACKAANAKSMALWRSRNLEHSKAYQRGFIKKLRQEVLDHYGGCCACCGETQLEFLSLDHKNGGGCKHRNEIKRRGANMWGW